MVRIYPALQAGGIRNPATRDSEERGNLGSPLNIFFLNYSMKTGTTITILGISALILYGIIQLLAFYGANSSQYGIYLTFYLFLLLSVFVLPNKEPTV